MSEKVAALSPRNVKLLPCLVYGSAFAMLVFYSIRSGWISHPILDRYVMGHPVSNVETVMLCVGLLALALKTVGLIQEQRMLSEWENPRAEELPFLREDVAKAAVVGENGTADVDEGSQVRSTVQNELQPDTDSSASEDYQHAGALLEVLELRQKLNRRESAAASTLTQRMTQVLTFIHSRRSAEGVDDHLKHLASQDADAQYDSYSLIRLMVWAIPMLGFLGTVIGISEALGGLDLGEGADLSVLITNLKSSLYVAFDTTALALTYGVILMFFQFGLDRTEASFMQKVDRKTEEFILKSFACTEEERDPVAKSIKRMGQALLKATFGLVEHQHDLWNESLTAAQDAWVTATENSQKQADHVLKEVVDGASHRMVEKLANAMEVADQQLQNRWQQWQLTLSDNARSLSGFQQNATAHIEMLHQFFENATHLSEDQQKSIQQLIGRLDQLVVQSQRLQEQQSIENEHRQEERRQVKIREAKRLKEERQTAERQREGIRWISEQHPEFVGPLSPAVDRELRRRAEQERLVAQQLQEEMQQSEKPSEVETEDNFAVSLKSETVEDAVVEESIGEKVTAEEAAIEADLKDIQQQIAKLQLFTEVEDVAEEAASENDAVAQNSGSEIAFSTSENDEAADNCDLLEVVSSEADESLVSDDVATIQNAAVDSSDSDSTKNNQPQFSVRPSAQDGWSIWNTFESGMDLPVLATKKVENAEVVSINETPEQPSVAPEQNEARSDVIEPASSVAKNDAKSPKNGEEINLATALQVLHSMQLEAEAKRKAEKAVSHKEEINRQVTSQDLNLLKIHDDFDVEHRLPQVALIPVQSTSKNEIEETPEIKPIVTPINSNVRSMLVPFDDAKVQRAS